MTFTILGGDLRSVYLVHRLLRDGHTASTYGLELAELPTQCRCADLQDALSDTDCVVLPIPTAEGAFLRTPYSRSTLDVETLSRAIPPHVPVFGGGKWGIPMVDLLTMESMTIRNAALTAQCALPLLQEHYPSTFSGARVLILGGGRIGKLLGLKLNMLGAVVTVTARSNHDKAWCAALGLSPGDLSDLPLLLPNSDIVINTVPAPILTERELGLVPKDTVLLELASAPGGFDPAAAQAQGISVVIGRGLPGKYAPKGAADIIADTIYNVLEI